jgi:hypothetical protein
MQDNGCRAVDRSLTLLVTGQIFVCPNPAPCLACLNYSAAVLGTIRALRE